MIFNIPETVLGRGHTDLRHWLEARGHRLWAGVDEVGRGCLAGPVVGGAVILNQAHGIAGIADSKILSPARRQALSLQIRARAVGWSVARIEAAEIDRINILQASLKAMTEAVLALNPLPDCVLVDGRTPLSLPMPQYLIVDGDATIEVIGAASIVAKVYRDGLMTDLAQSHAGYSFDRHKGYGTKDHLEELRQLGPTCEHRQSFAPVRDVLHSTQSVAAS